MSSSFLELDKIHSLQDIRDKLDRTCLAPGYTELYQDSNLYFLFITTDPTDLRPYVKLSLTITEELEFSAFVGSLKISNYKFYHITRNTKIETSSEVLNILSFFKNLGEENKRVDACGIEYCISIIEDISSRAELEKEKKFKFI